MKWGLWNSVAANNSSTPPDGWPEGQLPSTVNDCAREMMAQIKVGIKDLQFIDLGVTPTRTGNNTFTMAGDQTQWFGFGNRVKCSDGANTLYGTVFSSTFTTVTGVSIRMDNPTSDLLTASMSAVAVGYPSAMNPSIPEGVHRNRNFFDNQIVEVWQRGNGPFSFSSGTGLAVYADRWVVANNTTSTFVCNVSRGEVSAAAANAPTLAQAGVFVGSSIVISVNVAQSVINAGNYFSIAQRIEGFDYRLFAQKPATISFWVNSDETGTFCVALRNTGQDRSFVQNYNITAAATWEKKVISIPKMPSAGTWDYSTGIGLDVWFTFACGSTLQGGAGNWTAGNIVATSSIGNFLRSAGNTLKFTLAKLNEGAQELPLEQRKFAEENAKCQRYLYRPLVQGSNRVIGLGMVSNLSTVDGVTVYLPTTMRAAPLLSISSGASFILAGAISSPASSPATNNYGNSSMWSNAVNCPGTGLSVGSAALYILSPGSAMTFKAEI